MKQRLNIASATRLNVLLCSSAAVLLAASGGANAALNMGAGQTSEPQPRLLATTTSVDTSTAASQVTQLYQSLLGRAPDDAGLAYWTQAVANGVPLSAVEAAIRSSDEYARLHNAGTGSTVTVPATTYNY